MSKQFTKKYSAKAAVHYLIQKSSLMPILSKQSIENEKTRVY